MTTEQEKSDPTQYMTLQGRRIVIKETGRRTDDYPKALTSEEGTKKQIVIVKRLSTGDQESDERPPSPQTMPPTVDELQGAATLKPVSPKAQGNTILWKSASIRVDVSNANAGKVTLGRGGKSPTAPKSPRSPGYQDPKSLRSPGYQDPKSPRSPGYQERSVSPQKPPEEMYQEAKAGLANPESTGGRRYALLGPDCIYKYSAYMNVAGELLAIDH